MRGPLVYCLEWAELPEGVAVPDVRAPRDIELTARHDPDLLGGVTVLEGEPLRADASVTCEVLNIAGRAVKTIVADRPLEAGINSLAWDGRNAAGLRAPGGMYLVRMTATGTGGVRWTSMGTLSLTR